MGQAYADDLAGIADDLAGIAATQRGQQRVLDAVHAHSLRWGWGWGWSLNAQCSMCTSSGSLGTPELSWGMCRLPTSDTVTYLGLRLELDGGWAAQQAAGAANGWAVVNVNVNVNNLLAISI